MDLTRILEKSQRNTMHRRIPPPLIEKPSSPIQMIKIILIRLTPPERHIRNLKIAPEMARRVAIRLHVMFGPPRTIRQPPHRIVVVQIFWMLSNEFCRLGPESRNRLRSIVEVDREAVGFVAVGHEAEYIVINVAEEMHFRLHAPVELYVCERRVFVEEPTVPAAHLMVGFHASILNIVFLQYLCALLKKLVIDP